MRTATLSPPTVSSGHMLVVRWCAGAAVDRRLITGELVRAARAAGLVTIRRVYERPHCFSDYEEFAYLTERGRAAIDVGAAA